MKKFYYTPGPSELYFTVEKHIKEFLHMGYGSVHHRSDLFHGFYETTIKNLKAIFDLPEDYKILFLGSASEIMERILQHTIEETSFHVVNGAFAERFYKFSKRIGKKVSKVECEWGRFPENINVNIQPELIALTLNETSSGVSIPLEKIYKLRQSNPDSLIAVDIVSSAPYDQIDFSKIDLAFFSVQKCFGLPPGLGVLLINQRAIEKSDLIHQRHPDLPSHHSIPNLLANAERYETTETPNSMAIYLLSKVSEDMLNKGMDMIRREINYKAAVLYQSVENSPMLKPFVREEKLRSKTIIVAETAKTSHILEQFLNYGIVLGRGYGPFREEHIRISNFPTHSKEQVEQIADMLMDLK